MLKKGAVPLFLGLGILAAGGCGSVLGPSCLDRQQTGTVATFSGRLEPGEATSHLVQYDMRGSQNDIRISWSGQSSAAGPRLKIYATSATCTANCSRIGHLGGYAVNGEIVVSSLMITGPGNGAPPDFSAYRLHIEGDPAQAATYSIVVTWFSGPDC